MNETYQKLSNVPQDALKTIQYGALKGKSDINPQWRYEALTNEFGLCGIGWKYEVIDTKTIPVQQTGELMVFISINLYIKNGEEWSAPIPGNGGDFLIIKDKNGIHGNDEAMKMAITDALGNAAKLIGVAANVYRGKMDSKYSRPAAQGYSVAKQATQTIQCRHEAKPQKTQQAQAEAQKATEHLNKNQLMIDIVRKLKGSKEAGNKAQLLIEGWGHRSINELSLEELQLLYSKVCA